MEPSSTPTLTSERTNSAGRATQFARKLALAQGGFWCISGVWPLLHRASFEWVTGPKTDFWLVETVGGLIAVIGLVLLLAGWREQLTREIVILALGSCVVLIAIDVIYAMSGRISRIYLADAVVEGVLALAWVRVLMRRAGRARST